MSNKEPNATGIDPSLQGTTLPNTEQTAGFEELIHTEEFKQWFGDWEHGQCDPLALDDNGQPRKFYHGTARSFDTFAHPATTLSNQGIDIDNEATFFFFEPRGAESYQLNLEQELVGTIIHISNKLNKNQWPGWETAIEQWNEVITAMSTKDETFVIDDGYAKFKGEVIGLNNDYGVFMPDDLPETELGVKPLSPHTVKTSTVAQLTETPILVPAWYNPRVVEAVVVPGSVHYDDSGPHSQHGGGQDRAHADGLRTHADTAVIDSVEFGQQLSIKDSNRVLIVNENPAPVVNQVDKKLAEQYRLLPKVPETAPA